MAIKTLRVFQEFTSAGYVPMPPMGNIDYGVTVAGTFPGTTPSTFQTDNPDIDVTVTEMTDFYVWIRSHGSEWNINYTRNVRVYPDSPLINNVVMGIIIANSLSGLPKGGTAGQILSKIDSTDYNAEWVENFADWTSQLKHTVKAGVALTKGQAVYVSSADGTNMVVSKASNGAESTSSKTLGIVAQNLALNAKGFVITEGLLSGLNTSSATIGDPIWLGTNGNLIFGLANKPVAPSHLVFIGIVTRVNANNGEIFIKVQNGFEIDELHNVLITSVLNKNILVFDSSTNLWKNRNIFGTQGYFPYYDDSSLMLNSNIWTDGGSIGINTITPRSLMDLKGTTAYTKLIVDNNGATGGGIFSAYQNGVETAMFGTDAHYQTNTSINAAIIAKQTGGGIQFYTNGSQSEKMGINSDGNVFIGQTPTWTTSATNFIVRGKTSAGHIGVMHYDMSIKGVFNTFNSLLQIGSTTFHSLAFLVDNTERGRINSSGRLLWGTTTDNGLDIAQFNGSIVATSIKKSGGTSSQYLMADGSVSSGNNGTVTSVSASVPTGFTISGSPITTSGTLAIAFSLGYSLPTNASQTNWDTAYTNRITSASAPISIVSNVISITQATNTSNGYLTSVDWTTFNNKQSALSGIGFVKISGTTISYDNNTYYLASNPSGYITSSALSSYVPTTRTLTINGTAFDLSADRSWTIATGSGTVTSVSATVPTGFAISGSPITTSGTLAISFALGYSLPTDAKQTQWDTAYTNRITNASSPLSISANVISIAQANGTTNGFLSSTDWATFNAKQSALSGSGFVKVSGSTISYDNTTYTPTSRLLTINGTSYDLSADRSWTITPGSGMRNVQTFTATSGQTTFTVTGGYTSGLVDVYVNGTRLSTSDYVATSGTNVVLNVGAITNDIVDIVSYTASLSSGINGSGTIGYHAKFSSSNVLTNSLVYDNGSSVGIGTTSPDTYTTFGTGLGVTMLSSTTNTSANLNIVGNGTGFGGISLGNSTIRRAGIFALDGSILAFYTNSTNSGTTLTESFRILSNGNIGIGNTSPSYKLDVAGDINITGSFRVNGVAFTGGGTTINGVGFVKANGTTISYDNSTYTPTNGTGASGTWGIGITGSAGSVSGITASQIVYGDNATKTTTFSNADDFLPSGHWNAYGASNMPYTSWWHLITNRHTNTANNFQLQIAGEFWTNDVFTRKVTGASGSSTTWTRLLNAITDPYAVSMNQYVRTTDAVTFDSNRTKMVHINTQSENRGHRVYSRTMDVNSYTTATSMRFTVVAGNNVQFQYELTFHATRTTSGNPAEIWYLRYTGGIAFDTSRNPNERWWDLREQAGNGIAGAGRNNQVGYFDITNSAFDSGCRLTCVVKITCNNWDAVTVTFP